MIIGLLVAASAVWGQSSLSFYAEAGIGTSRLYGRHSGSDTQTAYKAGVGAEYTLNRTWALQSALEFISIGGKDDMQYVEHAKMHELYLQIPEWLPHDCRWAKTTTPHWAWVRTLLAV